MTACGGDQTTITDDPATYTYRNPDAILPDYDTDVIRVDGALDEPIYDTLRFWEEPYPEDIGVNVRATAYAGEKGIQEQTVCPHRDQGRCREYGRLPRVCHGELFPL